MSADLRSFELYNNRAYGAKLKTQREPWRPTYNGQEKTA